MDASKASRGGASDRVRMQNHDPCSHSFRALVSTRGSIITRPRLHASIVSKAIRQASLPQQQGHPQAGVTKDLHFLQHLPLTACRLKHIVPMITNVEV